MQARSFAVLLAAVLLSGAVAVTHAVPAEAQAKPSGAAKADPKEEAKKAYLEGKDKFKAGDYAGALPLFQKADSLYPGAAPKHKAAVCLDKLGRVEDSIGAYRAFIDSNPGEKYAERVKQAQTRIAA